MMLGIELERAVSGAAIHVPSIAARKVSLLPDEDLAPPRHRAPDKRKFQPTKDVLCILADGRARTLDMIRGESVFAPDTARKALVKLMRQGEVEQVRIGPFQLFRLSRM